MLASQLPVEELVDQVSALLVASLPVRACEVLTRPLELRPGTAVVPLTAYGQTVGTLVLSAGDQPVRLSDVQLDELDGVRSILGLAITAARWRHAVETERERIAQDLHDSVGQLIAAAGLRVEAHVADATDEWRGRLGGVLELLSLANQDLRAAVDGLLFRESGECGLEHALAELGRQIADIGGIAVGFSTHGSPRRLAAAASDALFRVAHEALANVVRHATATSATVELRYGREGVTLSVHDDGIGLVDERPLHDDGHFGVTTMRRRIADVGGELRIERAAAGGVLVEAVIPGRKVTAHDAGTGGRHR